MRRDIFDRIMSLPGLRRLYKPYEKHKELLLYIFFGGCTTVISIGTFALLDRFMSELIANLFSWVFAVGFAYLTNRIWVFRSQVRGKAIWKEIFTFYGGRLLTLGIEEGVLLVFVTWLAFPGTAVKIAGQVLVLIGNYVISKHLIFRKGNKADSL